MTLDEQIKYMEIGLEAITNALQKDKAMVEAQRIRMMDHGIAYTEIIATLRGLQAKPQ